MADDISMPPETGIERSSSWAPIAYGHSILPFILLLEIPLTQVRTLVVEPSGTNWSFRLDGQLMKAEFIYEGSFAQHLAGVAEATVRSRLNRELQVLP